MHKKKNIYMWCYIFLLPTIIMYLLFSLWPMIATFYFSLFHWDGVGWPKDYIGLQNYSTLVHDPYFWNAFKNTFFYAIVQNLIKLPLALIIAIILNNSKLKGRTLYRVLIFLPVVTPTAVIGLVFRLLLNPFFGPVNGILQNLHLITQPIDWLGPSLAMWTIIIVSTWQVFGRYMIYWMAGLQTIPNELYEAASIDGANSVQRFLYITLPMLKKIAVVITLFGFVFALRVFDFVKVMTDGGPSFRTDVVSTYIYRLAFEDSNIRIGFASAVAMFFVMVLVSIGIVQQIIRRRTS